MRWFGLVRGDSLELGQGGVDLEALAKPDGALVSDVVVEETAKTPIDGVKNSKNIKVAHRGLLFE